MELRRIKKVTNIEQEIHDQGTGVGLVQTDRVVFHGNFKIQQLLVEAEHNYRILHIPQMTEFYVERDDDLDYVRRIYNAPQSEVIAITGLGGVGKSQFAKRCALEYAKIHRYSTVYWLNAENIADEVRSFLIACNSLDSHDSLIASLRRYYSKNKDWLLVFDNACCLESVADYLPGNTGNGFIIVTTRDSEGVDNKQHVELSVWSQLQTMQFLQMRLSTLFVEDDAKLLVKSLLHCKF